METKHILIFILIVIVILVLVFIYFYLYKKNKFIAKSKYGNVTYELTSGSKTLEVDCNFTNLQGISAIHIHTNNNGMPGPILAWLATSPEWDSGVLQNTPKTNLPCCCNQSNSSCSLVAPPSTPLVSNLSSNSAKLKISLEGCADTCPLLSGETFLVFHGYNFSRIVDGKVVGTKPGIDLLEKVSFVQA